MHSTTVSVTGFISSGLVLDPVVIEFPGQVGAFHSPYIFLITSTKASINWLPVLEGRLPIGIVTLP